QIDFTYLFVRLATELESPHGSDASLVQVFDRAGRLSGLLAVARVTHGLCDQGRDGLTPERVLQILASAQNRLPERHQIESQPLGRESSNRSSEERTDHSHPLDRGIIRQHPHSPLGLGEARAEVKLSLLGESRLD